MLALLSTAAAMRPQVTRRALPSVGAGAAAAALVGPAVAAAEVEQSAAAGRAVGAMQKLDSGVRYIDLKEGAGAGAGAGSKMTLQWVLRRSNGYFVSSSFGQLASGPDGGVLLFGDPTVANKFEPFIFTVGSGGAVPGLDEAVRGMKKGGVRRVVVPAPLAFSLPLNKSPGPVPDDFGSKRQIERELQRQDPYNYFLFEVEATNVR